MDTSSSLPPPASDPWITRLPPAPDEHSPSLSPWVTVDCVGHASTVLLPPAWILPWSVPPIPPGALGAPTEVLPPPLLAPVVSADPWHAPAPPAYLFTVAAAARSASVPAATISSIIPASPAPPAPLPLDLYPLERCARIDAAITHRPARADEILEGHGLDAPAFRALRQHYRNAIQADLRQGNGALLLQYDAAFVAALERVRGPLTPDDFARLAIAGERGDLEASLSALDLPGSALPALQRVRIARASKDPKLRAVVAAD
jgi:hypothetical protein